MAWGNCASCAAAGGHVEAADWESGIEVNTILEKLAVNKTVRDLEAKCTILGNKEGNRYDQDLVVWLIYHTYMNIF